MSNEMTPMDYVALQIKNGECGRCQGSYLGCADCEFSCVRTGKPCNKLTADEIFNIRASHTCKKEDKTMTKKEEIQQEIEKTQKQLAALQEKLKEAEDEVPETLDFVHGAGYMYIDSQGELQTTCFAYSHCDVDRKRTRRAFKNSACAEMFAKKSQFIADLLHFKYLYDRDYEPDWSNYNDEKWFVYYNCGSNKYNYEARHSIYYPTTIYFSTKEIAKKCADWLNKRNKE